MPKTTLATLMSDESARIDDAIDLSEKCVDAYPTWLRNTFGLRVYRHINKAPEGERTTLTRYVRGLLLSQTFRGEPKEVAQAKSAGDHGYGPDVRKTWANRTLQIGVEIYTSPIVLAELYLTGNPFSAKLVFSMIENAFDIAIAELLTKHEPGNTDKIQCNVLAPDLPVSATIDDIKNTTLDMSFTAPILGGSRRTTTIRSLLGTTAVKSSSRTQPTLW